MAVLEDLKRDFQFEIRTRGKQYYLDDAVHIQPTAEPGAIKAHVTGGEKYRVEIRWEPMGMAYACTCPYFQDNDLPCKHLWATLLEADHQGVLETAARRIEVMSSVQPFERAGDCLRRRLRRTCTNRPSNGNGIDQRRRAGASDVRSGSRSSRRSATSVQRNARVHAAAG